MDDILKDILEDTPARFEAAMMQRQIDMHEQEVYALRVQAELATALTTVESLEQAFRLALSTLLQFDHFDTGMMYVAQPHTGDLQLVAYQGLSPHMLDYAWYHNADSPEARLALRGAPVYGRFPDIAAYFPDLSRIYQKEGVRAVACVPIQYRADVVGLMVLCAHYTDDIVLWMPTVLEATAAQLASLITGARAEKQARQHYEHWQQLFDGLPLALLAQDHDGRIVLANTAAAALAGDGTKPLVGCMAADVLPSNCSDGAPLETHFPLTDAQGKVTATGSFFISECEYRQLEAQFIQPSPRPDRRVEELETANKEMELFSAAVAHSLRTPLWTVDVCREELGASYAHALDDEGRDYLERIEVAVQHMRQLIDDLLRFGHVHGWELRAEQVDLSTLAHALAQQLTERDPERQITWTIAPGMVVSGDATLLRVVLENLLENAWKFTRTRSRAEITVSVRSDHDRVVYFVHDNGIGFNMQHMQDLFAAFRRLHVSSEFPGTGIGLALVQRIIRRHGGAVWAESAPGQGATFSFTLRHQKQ